MNKEYHRNWYHKNREKILEKRKEARKKNPSYFRERDKKQRLSKGYKERIIKHRYGISIHEYKRLFDHQNGLCAICKKTETRIDKRYNKIRDLSIDHCHKTGKIRGLLCGACNTAFGLLKEDKQIIKNLMEYLDETK